MRLSIQGAAGICVFCRGQVDHRLRVVGDQPPTDHRVGGIVFPNVGPPVICCTRTPCIDALSDLTASVLTDATAMADEDHPAPDAEKVLALFRQRVRAAVAG